VSVSSGFPEEDRSKSNRVALLHRLRFTVQKTKKQAQREFVRIIQKVRNKFDETRMIVAQAGGSDRSSSSEE